MTLEYFQRPKRFYHSDDPLAPERPHLPKRRSSKKKLTIGEINRSIDELFHPFFRKGPLPILADSLAHSLVEQDPARSLEKFLEFNFGPLVRETLKLSKHNKRAKPKRPKNRESR
jgi:hypothetical protein